MFNNTYTLKNALLQFSQGGVYKDQGWHRPITQWVSKFTARCIWSEKVMQNGWVILRAGVPKQYTDAIATTDLLI